MRRDVALMVRDAPERIGVHMAKALNGVASRAGHEARFSVG
jgi:hypothetical protein